MNASYHEVDTVKISRSKRPTGEEGEEIESLSIFIHSGNTCDHITISSKSGKALRVKDG